MRTTKQNPRARDQTRSMPPSVRDGFFLCPHSRCARYWTPQPGDELHGRRCLDCELCPSDLLSPDDVGARLVVTETATWVGEEPRGPPSPPGARPVRAPCASGLPAERVP